MARIFVQPETIVPPSEYGCWYINAFAALMKNPACVMVHAVRAERSPDKLGHRLVRNSDRSINYEESGFSWVPMAWIEDIEDGEDNLKRPSVYEPTLLFTVDKTMWYNRHVLKNVHKYDISKATQAFTGSKSYGPWEIDNKLAAHSLTTGIGALELDKLKRQFDAQLR